ncbi:MAG: hypothetical protein HY072_00330 [Deltaproteobacteria bacterium]|nr:hypothetical protein [Deltaproteobacteria bacterium]
MQRFIIFLLFIFQIISQKIFANESASSRKADARQEISISTPVVIKTFSPPASEGIDSKYTKPGIDLSARFHLGSHLLLGLEAQVSPYVGLPIIGGDIGLAIQWGLKLRSEIGVGIFTQKVLTKEPFRSSQFSVVTSEVYLSFIYQLESLLFQLKGTLLSPSKTTISNQESLETSIDHYGSFLISPSLKLNLPLNLLARVEFDYFLLGKTAIASREFAFGISQHHAQRYQIGAGLELGEFEIWAYGQFVLNLADVEEHYYQAPFLGENYLLAKNLYGIKLVWKK